MTSSSDSEPAAPPASPASNPEAGDDRGALIELQGVSLRFLVPSNPSPTLKQTLFNRLFDHHYARDKEFWLYRDLSLRIDHGQRVGLIGPNGAGKSTLLKVMCGIYHPTAGSVRIAGKVAPLIEIGAGLHPELTGIENIHLKGALLGYSEAHMNAKVQEILAFAELADMASVPIKYYSSGQASRLAFAIASDVDPDILMLDEVFSVGDLAFQRKAQAKMNELIRDAQIMILVSHSLELIKQNCTRVVWLDKGTIRMDGDPSEVCEAYTHSVTEPDSN